MSVRLRDAGNVQRKLKGIKVRDAGNVIRTIKRGKIRDSGNALRTFWDWAVMVVNPMIGTITANSWTQYLGNKTVSTGPQDIIVVGGTAPLTYAWTKTAGDAAVSIAGGTTNAPTFSANIPPDTSVSATCQCVVTDATGATITVIRYVSLELFYLPPAGEPIP
jgi:hypothetical protein